MPGRSEGQTGQRGRDTDGRETDRHTFLLRMKRIPDVRKLDRKW